MQSSPPAKLPERKKLTALVLFVFGLLLLGWLLNTPPGIFGKADAVGYAVCHRIETRSFHLGDRALPLCARCTGMYLGAVTGIVYLGLLGGRRSGNPPWKIIATFALFLVLFGIDGANSYLHLFPRAPHVYEPQNWLRLLTGTGMGLVISVALVPAFNSTMWANWDNRPIISSWRAVLGLFALAAVVDVLVLLEIPWILFPFAFVSAGGVILLLVMVYSMIAVLVLRLENRYQHWNQMVLPLAAGFLGALAQIAMLDLARYLLTGTWGGFTLG